MSITALLLEFLMNLLRDPQAAAQFLDDPQGSLNQAGLSSICADDVDAVVPVLLDSAPVAAIGGNILATGGNTATGGDTHYSGGGSAPSASVESAGGEAPAALPPAVAQLTHVVNNFSYTSIDDRDTITDQSVNQNIWALGDVRQLFDNEAIVASGDGAAAAGGNATADNSDDHSTNVTAGSDVNVGNTDVSLDHALNDNSDHSTDNSVHLDHALNDSSDHSTDNSVHLDHSLNDSSDHSDNSDNSVSVDLDNSLNDNSDNSDNSNNSDNSTHISDSFQDNSDNSQTDNSQTDNSQTDNSVAVSLHDSLNDNSDNSDNSTQFENSLNDNSTDVGNIDAHFTSIDDSTVLADNNIHVDAEAAPVEEAAL